MGIPMRAAPRVAAVAGVAARYLAAQAANVVRKSPQRPLRLAPREDGKQSRVQALIQLYEAKAHGKPTVVSPAKPLPHRTARSHKRRVAAAAAVMVDPEDLVDTEPEDGEDETSRSSLVTSFVSVKSSASSDAGDRVKTPTAVRNKSPKPSCCKSIASFDQPQRQRRRAESSSFPVWGFDEYATEIYANLQDRQHAYHVTLDYFRTQPQLKPSMRLVLIDWLIEVHHYFQLENDTLYLLVNYIDRYLAQVPMARDKVQLLGIVALWMASKFEEIFPMEIADLLSLCEDIYKPYDLIRLEQDMLRVLEFNLTATTSNSFLTYFYKFLTVDPLVVHLANYFSEHALLDFTLCREYVPSMIAASTLLLAQYCSSSAKPDISWVLEFEEITGYAVDECSPCLRDLHALVSSKPAKEPMAVRVKFSSSRFDSVSERALPPIHELLWEEAQSPCRWQERVV